MIQVAVLCVIKGQTTSALLIIKCLRWLTPLIHLTNATQMPLCSFGKAIVQVKRTSPLGRSDFTKNRANEQSEVALSS